MARRSGAVALSAFVLAAGAIPAAAWSRATVSAYSPNDAGPRTATGQPLTWSTNVVAHRSLPFGTKVLVRYGGRTVLTEVGDRGPYISGREFDLAPGVWRGLGYSSPLALGVRTVDVVVLAQQRRPVARYVKRPGRTAPRSVWAAGIEGRAAVLLERWGVWPPPRWDRMLTMLAARWVAPTSGPRAVITCTPAGSATTRFACRIAIGGRVARPCVVVYEDGGVRTVARRRCRK